MNCEFCNDLDGDGTYFKEVTGDGDIIPKSVMANIEFITDSKIKKPALSVCLWSRYEGEVIHKEFPINFCPFCGRRLNEGN